MTNLATTFSSFAAQLRDFIHTREPGEARFAELARELFALQFTHNAPYRRLCESRHVTPQTLRDWRDIPAAPTAAFKEFEFTSLAPADRTRVFHSSGTTGQRPSRHFHHADSLAIYEASLLPWFREHLLTAPAANINFLALTPPPADAPNSSLVHMFETVGHQFGAIPSGEHTRPRVSWPAPSPATPGVLGTIFCGHLNPDHTWNLDCAKVLSHLHQAIANHQPITLLGTAFNYVHLLDHCAANQIRLTLPQNSIAMETGGYKGRSRTLPKAELHSLITKFLAIPAANIVCEYGMSELSSQAYDTAIGQTSPRTFHFPPWARAQIISPETNREVRDGETGLIRIFDLANVYSVMAIQTEDLATRRGHGFELLGRATHAEARGCSLQSI